MEIKSLGMLALQGRSAPELPNELRAVQIEVVESEAGLHGKSHPGAGNQRQRTQRDGGDIVHFDQLFQALPGAVWNFPEIATGESEEIDDDAWHIAIAENQIGGLDGLLRSLAADPEQFRALHRGEGGGIEAVPAIDQGEFRDSGNVLLFQQCGDDERKPGRRVGGNNLGDGTPGKRGGIPQIQSRRGTGGCPVDSVMRHREFFPKLLLELGKDWIRHGLSILSCFK